jgi:hypothetical protein
MGDHLKAYRWLWEKHGVDVLIDAVDDQHERMKRVVKKIRKTEASGVFGIGVKLAALEPCIFLNDSRSEPDDCAEALSCVLGDINRLVGTDFAVTLYADEYADEEEDDEAHEETLSA